MDGAGRGADRDAEVGAASGDAPASGAGGTVSELDRRVSLVVAAIAVVTLVAIPLKILALGFLPTDDALRHAAFAVSGKSWHEVLVLRDGLPPQMDSHPGWHALLRAVHALGAASPDSLVVASVCIGFLIVTLPPAFVLRRPETWLISLMALNLTDWGIAFRLFRGRPYLVSMALVVTIALLYDRLLERRRDPLALGVMAVMATLSTWMHGTWYLLSLPVFALLLARRWRAAVELAAALGAGVVLGALLTGYPVGYLVQIVEHLVLALGRGGADVTRVVEFRPYHGSKEFVLVVLLTLVWRVARGDSVRRALAHPTFLLALTGWVLGFYSRRFWVDWGAIAACVWLARQGEQVALATPSWRAGARVGTAVAAALALFFSTTSDIAARWTEYKDRTLLSADDPRHAGLLPGPGGIAYANNMSVFYDTFYANPHGDWRYLVGYEPGLMPPADVEVWERVLVTGSSAASLEPWARRLRPEDRLIVMNAPQAVEGLPALRWQRATAEIWVGRRADPASGGDS